MSDLGTLVNDLAGIKRSPLQQIADAMEAPPAPPDERVVRVSWDRGLADTVHFGCQIPLWVANGYVVKVRCAPDKAELLKALGAFVNDDHDTAEYELHPWAAPSPSSVRPCEDWVNNRPAFNLCRSGVMPPIGAIEELWPKYLSASSCLQMDLPLTDPRLRRVLPLVESLPRPLAVLHVRGDAASDPRDYRDKTLELLRWLLELLGGSVIVLDWHGDTPRLHHGRVRCMLDDFDAFDIAQTVALIGRADLFLGIDAGPLHLCRLTGTPAVGIWPGANPAEAALPRASTVHCCKTSRLTHARRLSYRILEDPANGPTPEFVAQAARQLLYAGSKIGGADQVLLQHLLDKTRYVHECAWPGGYIDRHTTFRAFLQRLQMLSHAAVIQTGCTSAAEDWSAGYSTYLLGYALSLQNGTLLSIDRRTDSVETARGLVRGLPVEVVCQDPTTYLKNCPLKFDAAYLDSHWDDKDAVHEAQALLPRLRERATVLIDDAPWEKGKYTGKGLAVPFLLANGFTVKTAGYQVLLTRDPAPPRSAM